MCARRLKNGSLPLNRLCLNITDFGGLAASEMRQAELKEVVRVIGRRRSDVFKPQNFLDHEGNEFAPDCDNGRKHSWERKVLRTWDDPMGGTNERPSCALEAVLKEWGAQVHSKGMAKPLFRPQRFLRRTQFLLFFLTAAYLMAGSLLLLQRSRFVLQQGFRGSSSNQAVPVVHVLLASGSIEARPVHNSYIVPKVLMNMDPLHGPAAEQKYGPRWLMSRNSELRQLRRRWFLRFVDEQEPVQAMGTQVLKHTSENKGRVVLEAPSTEGKSKAYITYFGSFISMIFWVDLVLDKWFSIAVLWYIRRQWVISRCTAEV